MNEYLTIFLVITLIYAFISVRGMRIYITDREVFYINMLKNITEHIKKMKGE